VVLKPVVSKFSDLLFGLLFPSGPSLLLTKRFAQKNGSFRAFLGLLGAALRKILHFGPFPVAMALIAHEKLPQKLDLGFPSSIFASPAKMMMTSASRQRGGTGMADDMA